MIGIDRAGQQCAAIGGIDHHAVGAGFTKGIIALIDITVCLAIEFNFG